MQKDRSSGSMYEKQENGLGPSGGEELQYKMKKKEDDARDDQKNLSNLNYECQNKLGLSSGGNKPS